MKQTKCHECWGSDGFHMSYCRSKGYSAVGPHPDALQAAPAKPTVIEQCHCGIARLDCEYHRTPAIEREYEVYNGIKPGSGLDPASWTFDVPEPQDDPAVWDAAIDCGDWAGAARAWGFDVALEQVYDWNDLSERDPSVGLWHIQNHVGRVTLFFDGRLAGEIW